MSIQHSTVDTTSLPSHLAAELHASWAELSIRAELTRLYGGDRERWPFTVYAGPWQPDDAVMGADLQYGTSFAVDSQSLLEDLQRRSESVPEADDDWEAYLDRFPPRPVGGVQ